MPILLSATVELWQLRERLTRRVWTMTLSSERPHRLMPLESRLLDRKHGKCLHMDEGSLLGDVEDTL